MKIATWNVNRIRARQAQVIEWIQRDQPDVLCLHSKRHARQVPEPLREMPDYWVYSGVSLHIRRSLLAEQPLFEHPAFDAQLPRAGLH